MLGSCKKVFETYEAGRALDRPEKLYEAYKARSTHARIYFRKEACRPAPRPACRPAPGPAGNGCHTKDILLLNPQQNGKILAYRTVKRDNNVIVQRKDDIIMKKQFKPGQFSLKEAAIRRIINQAENPRDRIIISLLYYCGLRRLEAVSIITSDIDYEKRRIRVIGKGDKERIVPVPDDLLSEIRFFIGKSKRNWLFPARRLNREHLIAKEVNRIVRQAAMGARIKNPNPNYRYVNPHLLRHSAARRLKDAGLPLETIGAFLGHSTLQVTADIYGLIGVEDVQDQVSSVLK